MIRDDLRLPSPVHIPHDIEVFAKLDVSPFEFYLAGSRYMGCAREDSDWDFLAQASDPIRQFLERAGFNDITTGDYDAGLSANTCAIYEKAEGAYKVQVQLKWNVQAERKCRDVIKEHMLEEHIKMTNEERNVLWNDLFRTLTLTAGFLQPIEF